MSVNQIMASNPQKSVGLYWAVSICDIFICYYFIDSWTLNDELLAISGILALLGILTNRQINKKY